MEDSKDRTLWVGNVSDETTEELLYELFLQAGPLERVTIPKDRETGKQKKFAFITFKHEHSVPFCINIFDGVYLHQRRLQIKTRNGSVHTSGKNPVDADKWGIGLLPHQSKGHGLVKPKNPPLNKVALRNGRSSDSNSESDQDTYNNNGDEYDTRRVVNADPGFLMPPPQGMPVQMLGYQGPGPRNYQRSQTWPGVMELPDDPNSNNGPNNYDSRPKQKYDERFNEHDSRDASRDSREVKRRRFEEHSPRDRDGGRNVIRDHDRSRSNRNSSYDRQRSYERTDRGGPVDNQIQQMANLQMQMIQQQQMQNVHGRSYGGPSQHYSGNGGYRRY
ncbi:RNA-binding protein 7-like [Lineus longissimus]|uniref:RNA-binding protein 7-like n=1 Tax=Lineus longissimus TaxID=88925 RepID=UPI002B4E7A3A